jgi:2-keto-4-pentenoate hydratase/2-oxohepta-3-ene-1,7-dioic acid hydratase in catechol pathway
MKIGRILTASGETVTVTPGPGGTLLRAKGDLLAGTIETTGETVEAAAWLPPVDPRAILCIGRNYAKHAVERGSGLPEWPVLFLKNPAAATGHGQPIRVPSVCGDEIDWEGELVAVIGREARNVPRETALDYVLGYTVGHDITARIWQSERGGTQWCRGKGFDTFAPFGPFLVTPEEAPDPTSMRVRTRVNGETVQDGNTSDMIFPVTELIAQLSQDTTLLPGTVLFTGTPEGIGWACNPKRTLHPGDITEVEIDGLGLLSNPVTGPGG